MGLISCPASATARAPLISAVQSTTTNLGLRLRVRCNELMTLGGGNSASFGQFDDGTDTNVKFEFWWADAGTGGPKRATGKVPGIGSINNGYAAVTGGGWANGRFAVIVVGYFGGHTHCAVYDDTGTGTLIDGLSQATSAWYFDSAYAMTLPVVTGMGQFILNHTKDNGNYALVYDSVHVLSSLPTLDAEPSVTGALAGWQFDDNPGTTPLATYITGGVTITPNTGSPAPSLIAGGAEGTQTYNPTLVVCSPNTLSLTVGGGNGTSTASTQDQYGGTGTLTPATRTYSASGYSGSICTVVVSGTTVTVTPVAAGTTTITITDTATGGGGATVGTIVVTVTSGATQYDWVSGSPSIATVGTGAATEQVTDVTNGTATLTITRHGTSISCTVQVICAGPGSGNEPSGMTPGVNTGDMTTPPATTYNGTWTEGTSIVTTFSNNDYQTVPGQMDPTKIQLCPDGPGIETIFDGNLQGGGNYVNWACSISPQPSGTKQGVLFLKFRVRARNWSNQSVLRSNPSTQGPLIVQVKIMEPRCGQASENHVIGGWGEDVATQNWLYVLLQNPTANVPTTNFYGQPKWTTGTNYTVGQYVWLGNAGYRCILNHTASGANQPPNVTYWVEYDMIYNSIVPNASLGFNQSVNWTEVQVLMAQETTPGVSGDAYVKYWVGAPGSATLAFDSTAAQPGPTWPLISYPAAMNMLASTSTKGWQYLYFNQVYGGLQPQYSPPNTMYLGLNQLYASTK